MMNKRSTTPFAAIARGIISRVVELTVSLDVEPTEIASIVAGLGWIIPLLLYPRFLETSLYLRAIAAYAPRVPLLTVTTVLLCYQLCALLLPRPIRGDVHRERRETSVIAQRWMQARVWGLRAGMAVWASMAVLLTMHAITPASILFGGLALGCWWGTWRLRVLIAVEMAVVTYLDAAAVGEAMLLAAYPPADSKATARL